MIPKKTNHFFLLKLTTLFCCICLLVSCEQRQEPVKIGFSINLSGRGGTAGEHIRDGALLAVDEINSKGGINGRPLLLLVRDDENSDEGIKKADESLINEEVVAIIGHSYSANTIKSHPYVTGHDTVLITAFTAATKLSALDDLFFRTSVDCNLYGQKLANLLLAKKIISVSFLMDMSNPEFVLDYVEQVRKYYHGTLSKVQFESRENPDWQKITDELLSPDPQAIIMLTESSMTAVAAQKLRDAHFAGPLIGTIWTQSPELMSIGGPSTEGISIISFINPDNKRPDYLEFSRMLLEKFNKPANARSARSYEMIHIIANALRRCDIINAQQLKTALLQGDYESILGPLKFDRFGDVIRPVYEVVVQNGHFRNNGEIR